MFTPPTQAALIALSQFVETPRWKDVDEMLSTEIEATTVRLTGARIDADAHFLRGYLSVLRDLQQTARTARSTLAKQGRQVPLT
jgi:hypothetical protein